MSAADLRKGWCPGALRPMAARDGLLVRLRITGGIVPAATARAIADLAATHGSGLLDLSARANLQIRGVGEAALPALLDGLAALGLLDDDAAGEAVRNVLCSPLAGVAPGWPDLRPLAAALEAALAGDRSLHALPPKFGFLLDDGSAPSLADIAADVRFDWRAEHSAFALGLGGTAATALPLGFVPMVEVVAAALAVARRCLAFPAPPRRARTLLREEGRGRVAAAFTAVIPGRAVGANPGPIALSDEALSGQRQWVPGSAAPPRNDTAGRDAADVVGYRDVVGVATLGLAVPFGRLDAAMLRAAAAIADAAAGELRLTPWRMVLIPGRGTTTDLAPLVALGFITDPADPRLRVAACVGRDGCERGTTDTHADAAALARLASPGGVTLHVPGRPSRTRS